MIDAKELQAALLRTQALWAATVETKLDIRVAEQRGGDVAAAKAADEHAAAAWHASYSRTRAMAHLFADQHGLDAQLLADALNR